MTETEQPSVLAEIDDAGVAWVTLNRPHLNNAYDGDMVQRLLDGVGALAANDAVRVIVIRGAGKHFQAGADLAWLNRVRTGTPEENLTMRSSPLPKSVGACTQARSFRNWPQPWGPDMYAAMRSRPNALMQKSPANWAWCTSPARMSNSKAKAHASSTRSCKTAQARLRPQSVFCSKAKVCISTMPPHIGLPQIIQHNAKRSRQRRDF